MSRLLRVLVGAFEITRDDIYFDVHGGMHRVTIKNRHGHVCGIKFTSTTLVCGIAHFVGPLDSHRQRQPNLFWRCICRELAARQPASAPSEHRHDAPVLYRRHQHAPTHNDRPRHRRLARLFSILMRRPPCHSCKVVTSRVSRDTSAAKASGHNWVTVKQQPFTAMLSPS